VHLALGYWSQQWPADLGVIVQETPFNTGHDLFELEKRGLAEKPDRKKSLYLITDKGRETLENPPEEVEGEELEKTTEEKH